MENQKARRNKKERSQTRSLPRYVAEKGKTNGNFGRGQGSSNSNNVNISHNPQQAAATNFVTNTNPFPRPPMPRPPSQFRGEDYYNLFVELLKLPLHERSTSKAVKEFQELNIDYQLKRFINSITMTQGDLVKRSQLLTELADLVRRSFPRCILYPFGSMSSGLGDHYSDIDIYVDIFGESTGVHANPYEGRRPTKQEIMMDIKKLLKFAKGPNNRPRYGKIIPVLSARVPILKFFHLSTKINVDMSFENLLSFQNTKMISFIMTLDECVKPLLLLVRYWGKFHELTGSTLIKNYAFILLVLVFLSTKQIIPTVHILQSLQKSSDCIDIDGWNAGFCDNRQVVLSSFQKVSTCEINHQTKLPTTRSILMLAQEFFHTCAHTDFSTNVVCSLTSQLIPKQNFSPGNEEVLPQALERYKNWSSRQTVGHRLNISTPFVLQDPFLLSFNVGGVTTEGTLLKFQVGCAQTAAILKENLKSILDLFIPLPKQVGEKKFMSMQRIHKRHEQLRKEIKDVLKHKEAPIEKQGETLPLHLLPIEKIISRKTVQYGQGWESFLRYSMGDGSSKTFRDLFTSELKCLTANGLIRQVELENKMRSLWIMFVKEFLVDVWMPCFGMTFSLEEAKQPIRRFTELGNWGRGRPGRGRRNTENIEAGVDVDMEVIDHGDMDSQDGAADNINETSPIRKYNLDKNLLLDRLNCIENQECGIDYFRFNCTTDTPFWTKREYYRKQAFKNMPVTADDQDYLVGSSKSKKKTKRASKRMREKQLRNQQMANPMLIEKEIMNLIRQNEILDPLDSTNTKSTFDTVFQCNCWIKLDSSYVDDWPEVVFILEKDFSRNYAAGGQVIMPTLKKLFPDFMLFKLMQWFSVGEDSDAESSKMEAYINEITFAFSDSDTEDKNESIDNRENGAQKPSFNFPCSTVEDR